MANAYSEQALFKVTFEGADGIALAFDRMEKKVAKRIVRRSLKAAGTPMLARVKALTPVSDTGSHGHLPGHLWRHVEMFTARAPGKGSYSIGVGIRNLAKDKDAPYYAPFVELGHYLGSRKVWRGKWTAMAKPGHRQVKAHESLGRDYVQGDRFLRDAFQETKDESVRILEAEIVKGIEEVWEEESRDFIGAFGPGGMSRRRASTI